MLFLQGGASLQFSMVPMNLLAPGPDGRLHRHRRMVEEGAQGSEAERGDARRGVHGGRELPAHSAQAELTLTPGAAYVHMTSNNTIVGTQWAKVPDVGGAPLVCDASSDIFSRPIDVSKFGLIYAGAQKNLGPSGVTMVIDARGSARSLRRVARRPC